MTDKTTTEVTVVPTVAPPELAAGLPPPSGNVHETKYRPELAAAILWRVAQGEGVKQACKQEGVHLSTFGYWLLRLPEVEQMYRSARRLAAQALFDDGLEQVRELIAGKRSASQAEVRATDVAISSLMKMSEVMNPAEFSNRQPVTPPIMVRIETTLNLNPSSGPPPKDATDIYTMAQKTMGTVIDLDEKDTTGNAPGDNTTGSVGGGVFGEAMDTNFKQRRLRQVKRATTPKVYTREVKDGPAGED